MNRIYNTRELWITPVSDSSLFNPLADSVRSNLIRISRINSIMVISQGIGGVRFSLLLHILKILNLGSGNRFTSLIMHSLGFCINSCNIRRVFSLSSYLSQFLLLANAVLRALIPRQESALSSRVHRIKIGDPDFSGSSFSLLCPLDIGRVHGIKLASTLFELIPEIGHDLSCI